MCPDSQCLTNDWFYYNHACEVVISGDSRACLVFGIDSHKGLLVCLFQDPGHPLKKLSIGMSPIAWFVRETSCRQSTEPGQTRLAWSDMQGPYIYSMCPQLLEPTPFLLLHVIVIHIRAHRFLDFKRRRGSALMPRWSVDGQSWFQRKGEFCPISTITRWF